jgi:hypothetical protein
MEYRAFAAAAKFCVRGQGDRAAGIRPNAGDRPEQSRFAGTGRAGQNYRLGSGKPQAREVDDLAAVRKPQIQSLDIEIFPCDIHARFWRKARRLRVLDREVERRQAVEHGFEFSERNIVGDKKGQGLVDAAKGSCRLRHDAERDLAGEVEGRRDDKGNDRAELAIGSREGGQVHPAGDDLEKINDDRAKPRRERDFFCWLAGEQRDLLGIFAQSRERKAEIGFIALLLEREADERAPD